MQLKSSAFEHGGEIPPKFTCDNLNINPPLDILDVPQGTRSLALIMEDPDVPRNVRPDGLFIHWAVFNMPQGINKIPENTEPEGTPIPNSTGKPGYTGPCPPDREHRYFFKLFALDTDLADAKIVSRNDLLNAIENHILYQAELMGTYNRRNR